MEEQKNTNLDAKQEQNKKQKPETKKSSFSDKVQDYKAEFRKIVWPNRAEVGKKTLTVIVTSLLVSVIIFCMDTVYTGGYNALLSLLASK